MTKLIIAIAMILVSAGLIFGYVRPTYNAALQKKAEVDTYAEGLAKAKEVQALGNALSQKFNTLTGTNTERLEKLLPDHVDNVHLVLDFDALASKHGLRIGNVQVRRDEADKNKGKIAGTIELAAEQQQQRYKSLVLEFSVVSSYPDFVSFMRDLEQSLRIVDLVSLNMTEGAKPTTIGGNANIPQELKNLDGKNIVAPIAENGDPIYRFTVAIRTYWLP